MGAATGAFVVFLFVAISVVAVLNQRNRNRMREFQVSGQPDPPIATLRRKHIAAATLEAPGSNSVAELVAEEAAATGVDNIAGGEGIDTSVKLRVWWRDEILRKGCPDGVLEFRTTGNLDASNVDPDNLRLVCVQSGVDAPTPDEPSPLDGTDTTGNHDLAANGD